MTLINEWTPIGQEMPEDYQFVIANICNGNYYYHEILCYKAEDWELAFS